jgi:hypothetical protein
MKKVLIATVAALAMTGTAHAIGDREQGALMGIAATLLWQKLDQNNNQPQPVYVQPQPVYVQPRTVYVQPAPTVIYQRQCQVVRETRYSDGSVVREVTNCN